MNEEMQVELMNMQTGIVRTLATICRQLIDRGVLNEELLIADLGAVQEALRSQGVSVLGGGFPMFVAAALRQPSEQQP